MDFKLSEDQLMLRDMVARFAADRYDPAERSAIRIPNAGHDESNWKLLADLGLLALPFGQDDGGLGGSAIDFMVVAEEFGRGVIPEPYLADILIAGRLLADAGTTGQKARWLAPVIAGTAHLALAHHEASSRFALDKVSTRVENDRITGDKTFVLCGTSVDAFIVSARDQDGRLGLFLVDGRSGRIEQHPYRLVDGSTAMEVRFAATPAEPMVRGIDALVETVDTMRVPIAAELVGLMSMLLDVTLEYVKVRKQFGAAIGSFQAIQHRLADQYLALELSRSLLLRAAMTTGDDGPAARLAAKAYIAEASVRLGEEAIQLHGGMGVTNELIVGHAHKRILLLASLFGDAETEARRYVAVKRGDTSQARLSARG